MRARGEGTAIENGLSVEIRERPQGEGMVGVGGGGGFEIAHVKSGFQILKERRGVPLDGCVAGFGFGGGVPEGGGTLIVGGGGGE